MIKGATDYSIPESHLTEMHQLANERFAEVEEMSSTIAALKLENQAHSSSSMNRPTTLHGYPSNAMPRNECEEKCAKLKAELDEMKQEKNNEVRNLQDELKKMEDRKDYYKNNFSQAVSTLKRILLGFKFSMKASNSCVPVIDLIVQTVEQATRHIRIVAHVIDLVQSILIFLTSFIKVSLEDFEQVLSVDEFSSVLQVQLVDFSLGFLQTVTFSHGLHIHLV